MAKVSLEDVDNIAPQRLQELRNCFNAIDVDHNGTICISEFNRALHQLRIFVDREEVQDLYSEYDMDGDNSLDFEEFIQLICKVDPRLSQEIEISKAFKLFDLNQDGFISKAEVSEALTWFGISASEADIELLFALTDHNNDGLINHLEFKNMLYDAPTPQEELPVGSSPGSPGHRRKSGGPSPKYIRKTYTAPDFSRSAIR